MLNSRGTRSSHNDGLLVYTRWKNDVVTLTGLCYIHAYMYIDTKNKLPSPLEAEIFFFHEKWVYDKCRSALLHIYVFEVTIVGKREEWIYDG